MLIALSGLAGAGKTTAIADLERRGVGARVYVGAFVTAEVLRRGLPPTPACEKRVREELRVTEGMDALARRALPTIRGMLSAGRVALVDAIYCLEERDFYQAALGEELICLAVETSAAIRAARLALRNQRPLSAAELDERDRYELERLGMAAVLAGAGHRVPNDGGLEDFEQALGRFAALFVA